MTAMTPRLLRTIRADHERAASTRHAITSPERTSQTTGRIGIIGGASAILAVALFLGSLPSMAGAPATPTRPGPIPAPVALAPVSVTAAR